MATLKDHQQAMVDLLASGSGIPASASRLAHAMHDVLEVLATSDLMQVVQKEQLRVKQLNDATTPGLNDKALAADVEACRPKAAPAERRVKELENTVKQLRASNAKLRDELSQFRVVITSPEAELELMRTQEQAGCRKPDAEDCVHIWHRTPLFGVVECERCGKKDKDQ